MIVSEFIPRKPYYKYLSIKPSDLLEACEFLLADETSLEILDTVGVMGDVTHEQAIILNSKLHSFVTQNGLLKAYHRNFAISVALARQKIAGRVQSAHEAIKFIENKYWWQSDSASGFVYDEASNTRPTRTGDIILIAKDIEANSDLMNKLRDYTSRQLKYGTKPDHEAGKEDDLRVTSEEWNKLWAYPSQYYTEKYGLINRKVLTLTSLRLINCVHFYDLFDDEYKKFYPNFLSLDDPKITKYLLEQSGRTSVGDIVEGDYV